MIADNWVIGGVALFGTLVLLTGRSFPAMFLLLFFGATVGLIKNPDFVHQLASATLQPQLPTFALASVSWHDVLIGTVFLALPQLPLTLGNAVIVTTEENNQLFPDRPVAEKGVSMSTGILNLFSSFVGGVPMCHGAGGTPGHVRVRSKDGGSFDYFGQHSSVSIIVVQQVAVGGVQGLPAVHSWRHPVPDWGATRTRVL